jgi:hypothetical protein
METPPSWRLQPYQHMQPGDKYQVTVNGAEHLSLAITTLHSIAIDLFFLLNLTFPLPCFTIGS